jgi:hypothetical protein
VKRRNYLEDPGTGGRLLLKMDVKKNMEGVNRINWLREGMISFVSIEGRKFLDQLSD